MLVSNALNNNPLTEEKLTSVEINTSKSMTEETEKEFIEES